MRRCAEQIEGGIAQAGVSSDGQVSGSEAAKGQIWRANQTLDIIT
jgi:hypothetical protein